MPEHDEGTTAQINLNQSSHYLKGTWQFTLMSTLVLIILCDQKLLLEELHIHPSLQYETIVI